MSTEAQDLQKLFKRHKDALQESKLEIQPPSPPDGPSEEIARIRENRIYRKLHGFVTGSDYQDIGILLARIDQLEAELALTKGRPTQ